MALSAGSAGRHAAAESAAAANDLLLRDPETTDEEKRWMKIEMDQQEGRWRMQPGSRGSTGKARRGSDVITTGGVLGFGRYINWMESPFKGITKLHREEQLAIAQ